MTNGWYSGGTKMIHGDAYGLVESRAFQVDPETGRHINQRRLDLRPYLGTLGPEWCERTARRWARANGFIRVYRPRASHRRMLRWIGRIRQEAVGG